MALHCSGSFSHVIESWEIFCRCGFFFATHPFSKPVKLSLGHFRLLVIIGLHRSILRILHYSLLLLLHTLPPRPCWPANAKPLTTAFGAACGWPSGWPARLRQPLPLFLLQPLHLRNLPPRCPRPGLSGLHHILLHLFERWPASSLQLLTTAFGAACGWPSGWPSMRSDDITELTNPALSG